MSLIFWNRMESATDPSIVGANPAYTGSPAFAACQYGNGANFDTNAKYLTATAMWPTLKGTCEFWYKAAASQATNSGFVYFNNGGFLVYWYNYGGTMKCNFWYDPEDPTYSAAITYAAGETMHLAMTWDGTAGAGERMHFYKNNAVLSMSVTSDTGWSDDTTANLVTSANPAYAFGGIMDNLKIYNHVKTDFSDRNNERAGMMDQAIIM